ncbi:glutamine-rich protein 2-like [Patagioenas fasciata]|uniref:glutamine-rich protein 2-like n=1 Tax=Patagioenas fasciata TaxID=372321 RepID=UPI003A98FAE7
MPFLEVSDGLGRQGVLGWPGGQLRPCRGVTGCCLPWKALSQALGRLKKQKADKEQLLVLGIDEKADKAALADKVSRSQFEACVERLNNVMEDVTSRVTGQEESWHRFQKELQRQMDCKVRARPLHAELAPWGPGSLREHPRPLPGID